jgi:hypothetical protein
MHGVRNLNFLKINIYFNPVPKEEEVNWPLESLGYFLSSIDDYSIKTY